MLRCPKCHKFDVEYDNGVWRCLWRDCLFVTKDYNEIKNAKHPIRKFYKFIKSIKKKTRIA